MRGHLYSLLGSSSALQSTTCGGSVVCSSSVHRSVVSAVRRTDSDWARLPTRFQHTSLSVARLAEQLAGASAAGSFEPVHGRNTRQKLEHGKVDRIEVVGSGAFSLALGRVVVATSLIPKGSCDEALCNTKRAMSTAHRPLLVRACAPANPSSAQLNLA